FLFFFFFFSSRRRHTRWPRDWSSDVCSSDLILQLWVPLSLSPDELSDQHSGFWGYHMIARLKDGVSLSQAAQDADRVAHQIMRDFPASMSAIQIQGDVRPLRETVVADVRPVLQMLFLAVAIVLLIACVNVSSL